MSSWRREEAGLFLSRRLPEEGTDACGPRFVPEDGARPAREEPGAREPHSDVLSCQQEAGRPRAPGPSVLRGIGLLTPCPSAHGGHEPRASAGPQGRRSERIRWVNG